MKAITIKQPWAWAIVHGGKDVENRSQLFAYRGPLLIHAGKSWDVDGGADPRVLAALRPQPYPDERGVIIGVADLVAMHPRGCGAHCSPWAERGSTHLRLIRPRSLAEPVPARGMLGLWDVPADVEASVRAQLGGAL